MQIPSVCRGCMLAQSDDCGLHCDDSSLITDNSNNSAEKSQHFNPSGGRNVNKSAIETALMKIGMPVSLKGFTYITDAVLLLDTPEWTNQKWTALYYKIAMLNKTTSTRVEKAIRNAFTITRSAPENYAMAEHYIGMTNCENSNSIMYLYKNLLLEAEAASRSDAFTYADLKALIRQTVLEMR